MTTSDEPDARALAYPYDPPAFGYAFRHDAPEPAPIELADFAERRVRADCAPLVDLTAADAHGAAQTYRRRVPVIAAGSNASFSRLKTKFAEKNLPGDFPVLRLGVRGLVPVYSAHISAYGSVPGTLTGEAAAESDLHIAFLNRAELERLNESESIGNNYALALLPLEACEPVPGLRLSATLAYVSRRGAFAPDGAPARLSAFSSRGSRYAPLDQRGVMQRVHAHLGAVEAIEAFIAAHISDAALRASRTAAMAGAALACAIAGMRCVAGGLEAPPGRLPEDMG